MHIDYSLYLVTDRGILNGRDFFKAVEDALKGGVTLLQLREKDISSLDFYNIAVKVKQISHSYNVPLIINDRLDIALAIDADGLHIGQEDLPIVEARKLLGPGKILGYSVSNVEESVYGEKNGADYLGAGPVYMTGSKSDAGAPIGPEILKNIKKSISIPVVGIGGIGVDNISEVKSSGADGISVISAILGKEDIEGTSKKTIEHVEKIMAKIFFIDFDGTITKKDTCCAMVEAFARDGWQELDKLWVEKKLSTKDCAEATFDLFDAGIEDLEKLLSTIEIDDYFKEFLKKCRDKGYKVYILSDGYDINIRTIFKRYDLDVPYYVNKLTYDGKFHIECTYSSASCKDCGTCKKEIMQKLKQDQDEAIYIGDGYSDVCPASAADMVFAKGVLYDYCSSKGIDAVQYNNFGDIIANLGL